MGSEALHEPRQALDDTTVEMHRGIVSLIEELEAVDWYQQRADACGDPELKQILLHHKREEIEHAMMNLEWLRRISPDFGEQCATYLFSEGSILDAERGVGKSEAPRESCETGGSLGIGSLKPGRDSGRERDTLEREP